MRFGHAESQGDVAAVLVGLGLALRGQERYTEAQPLVREGLEIRQAVLPDGHWLIANTKSILGGVLAGEDRFEEAELLLLEGYAGLKDNSEAPTPRKREAIQRIVDLYDAWGKLGWLGLSDAKPRSVHRGFGVRESGELSLVNPEPSSFVCGPPW